MYTFSYMAIGILFTLMPQYLSSIGFTGTEIGALTAGGVAIGIVSTPILASFYEHKNKSKAIMTLVYIMPGIFVGMMRFSELFIVLLSLYICALFFQAPMFSLEDSNTLASSNDYGKVRMWGAGGYAVGSLISGLIADKLGLINIFQGHTVAMFLAAICFLTINKSSYTIQATKQNEEKTSVIHGFKMLAGNKKFIQLTISAFFVVGTSIAHNTYFSFMFKDAGGDLAGVGLAFLLMAGSEMPFMQATDYLLKKIPIEKLLIIPMVVAALRFFWLSTLPDPMLIYGLFFLQGIANGLFIVGAIKYVDKLVGESKRSVAVSIYTAATVSCGSIVCQFLGGLVMDLYSASAVYLMYSIMNVIALILYLTFRLHKTLKNANVEKSFEKF